MRARSIEVGILLLFAATYASSANQKAAKAPPLSQETQACISCHETATPGIVADWKQSRHARRSPRMALAVAPEERRMSAAAIGDSLKSTAVGCYECHSLNGATHKDGFDHFGYRINIVVSPNDCGVCHPVERAQYADSKKAHAHDNLQKNGVYTLLLHTTTALPGRKAASTLTMNETCLACHGTQVDVVGTRTVNTDAGEIEVPRLSNWPNMGVGRINPDGSRGACTACHPRHGFSITVARSAETCGQCHLEPDVPAYNIYKESKHGNIYEVQKHTWNFDAVPWMPGRDFTAPTCAACHVSELTTGAGSMIAQRTHDFGGRTWVRIFGLPTSHPQPIHGRTYEIRNGNGLPLPVTFAGVPADSFLLSVQEQNARRTIMQGVCRSCHSTGWVEGHFTKFDTTVAEADSMVLAATRQMSTAWAAGRLDNTNPFDEVTEHAWVQQWLFYANSLRAASAMSGPDYAAFKYGWWELTTNLRKIKQDSARTP